MRFKNIDIYLEINQSHVFISTIKQEGNRFSCALCDEQLLCSLEVGKGGIFNPSMLHLFIKNFLQKHSFSGAKTVVCCPYIAGCSKERKELCCFQLALCVCKAGLHIEAVFDERILMERY